MKNDKNSNVKSERLANQRIWNGNKIVLFLQSFNGSRKRKTMSWILFLHLSNHKKINHRKLNEKWERKYFWHYLSFLCSELALLPSPNRAIPPQMTSRLMVSGECLPTSLPKQADLSHLQPCYLLQWQAVMQAWGCITIQKTTQKNRRSEKWKSYFG